MMSRLWSVKMHLWIQPVRTESVRTRPVRTSVRASMDGTGLLGRLVLDLFLVADAIVAHLFNDEKMMILRQIARLSFRNAR